MSGDEFVKVVAKIGFAWDRTEGSHMLLMGPMGRRLSVPQAQGAGSRSVEGVDPRHWPD